MGVENDARRRFQVHELDECQQRGVLDDIADISSVIDVAIIHSQSVPEPTTDRNEEVGALLQAGYAAETSGDVFGAVECYQDALRVAPDNSEAWSALGQALVLAGDIDTAAEALTTALALDHQRSDLALLLADLYRRQGRLADAEDELRTFLRLTPDSRIIQQMLAEILGAQKRYDAAATLGRELALLGTMSGDFTKQLCDWLAQIGSHRDAIQYLTRHLSVTADDAEGWLQLGNLWLTVQEPQKADAAWAHYRALYPDDQAQTSGRLVARLDAVLSPDYIRALFDGYADNFDHDLQDKLRYHAPELLQQAVARVWNGAIPPCDMLDLGCGTGLSGKAFEVYRRNLVGIDLSPRMLGYAEATGLYNELVAADIVPWMNATTQQFDLVLAADVLVYMGDLKPLFTAVRRVLKSGGLFAATAEQMAPIDDQDFLLQAKRRYAHGEGYLLRLAETCGFRLKALDFITPRYEAGQPVPGVLFVVEG